ncbi:uncharacterized protein LOC117620610 [Prunus dulcis]|uniref:uncharacterized protein LOC117620610 n=1 Tax=Prunus dulcis TaxID=3755 RepID=UPI001482F6B7|nr:uncharacterized protein LOC117620610 [Prunus dulcis]XP_034206623.1 uncharacterized protein LOC117620610 [Prunus dulcis]
MILELIFDGFCLLWLIFDRLDICFCTPGLDRSVADVSVTVRETIYVSSSQINSATSFEVSGNLSLSGLLTPRSVSLPPFSSACTITTTFYSDAVAGAREALIWCIISVHVIELEERFKL